MGIGIIGATVHVGNGTVIENATVVINEGVITEIGAGLPVPSGYERIDASGKQIYPGLIALNSQLGLTEIGAVRATNDQREVGTFNPNARALIAFNTDSQVIPTVRSRGVLLAQTTPEGSLVSGRSSIVQLDGWNFEDAAVRADDGVHVNWPRRMSWNWQTGALTPNKRYDKNVRSLESFLEQAIGYCGRADGDGERLLKLEAFCEAISGNANAYLHANEARDIQAGVLLLKRNGGQSRRSRWLPGPPDRRFPEAGRRTGDSKQYPGPARHPGCGHRPALQEPPPCWPKPVWNSPFPTRDTGSSATCPSWRARR